MRRTPLALAALPVLLALAPACKHDDGRPASTVITSGTPEAVPASTTPDPSTEKNRSAERIAAALCSQERLCVSAELPDMAPEATLLGEAACIAELKPVARQSVEAWDCSPAVARAGFKECLSAVSAEIRCRDVLLGEASPVVECRPSNICHKGQGIAIR